jgi:segregation and condensation protein B
VSPRRPAELTPARLPALLEALLFVAGGPVEEAILAKSVGLPLGEVQAGLEKLAQGEGSRGVRLQRSGTRVQFVTEPAIAEYVERFLGIEQRTGLSNAALEVLAIIAYRQPVTRGGIEAIRGVNSDNAVATLVQRELVEEVGRASGPGKAALFGTTIRFLEHFGLKGPEELPPLDEEAVETVTS